MDVKGYQKQMELYMHTLFFEREMTAETAPLIVPSHVDGFHSGTVNPYDAFNAHVYTFLTYGQMPWQASSDLFKLSGARGAKWNMPFQGRAVLEGGRIMWVPTFLPPYAPT